MKIVERVTTSQKLACHSCEDKMLEAFNEHFCPKFSTLLQDKKEHD